MAPKRTEWFEEKRYWRARRIRLGTGLVLAAGFASLAVQIALHGRWPGWPMAPSPPGSVRVLAETEVTNAAFNECLECRTGNDAQGKSVTDTEEGMCIARVEHATRTVEVVGREDEQGVACLKWKDAIHIADRLSKASQLKPCYSPANKPGQWNRVCERRGKPGGREAGFRLVAARKDVRTPEEARERAGMSEMTMTCEMELPVPPAPDGDRVGPKPIRMSTYRGAPGKALLAPEQAVVCVTWDQAKRYADWRNAERGIGPCYNQGSDTDRAQACPGFRLPTKQEWTAAVEAAATRLNPAPRARELCGHSDGPRRCKGIESGQELKRGDAPKGEVHGLALGVLEMVHAHESGSEDAMTLMGWTSADAFEGRITNDTKWPDRPQGKGLKIGDSRVGLRLLEPGPALSAMEWISTAVTGETR